MSEPNQFLGQIGDDPVSAAVEVRRHTLIQWCNLSNTHDEPSTGNSFYESFAVTRVQAPGPPRARLLHHRHDPVRTPKRRSSSSRRPEASMARQELLVRWLNDAYAMEHQLIPVLENPANDMANYPRAEGRLRKPIDETRRHAARMDECTRR